MAKCLQTTWASTSAMPICPRCGIRMIIVTIKTNNMATWFHPRGESKPVFMPAEFWEKIERENDGR